VAAQFDHEKLDVYRMAIAFLSWVSPLLEDRSRGAPASAMKHLDDASTSVALNIAEGNGKRSVIDRARFLDIARGSALESAACLDVLVARERLTRNEVAGGKEMLLRIVAMLTKLIERLTTPEPSTSTSTSTF
jgi:four helix bundle protein